MRKSQTDTLTQAEQIEFRSIAQGLIALKKHLSQLTDIDSSYEESRERIETAEVNTLADRNRKGIAACIDKGIDIENVVTVLAKTGGPNESQSANIMLGILFQTTEDKRQALQNTIVKIIRDFAELLESIKVDHETTKDLKRTRRFLRYILGESDRGTGAIAEKIFCYLETTGEENLVRKELDSFLLGIDYKLNLFRG